MVPEARTISDIPVDIGTLLEKDQVEGHRLVERLVVDWREGINRFDKPGETLVEVRCGPDLCAIGGLNIDPYLDDPTVGRIRHVYVDPGQRRQGVGRILIQSLVGAAYGHFEKVRLRSVREGGPSFYEALGFVPTTESEATHVLWLRGHTAAK